MNARGFGAIVALLLASSDAFARRGIVRPYVDTPVVVALLGPDTVRVRVAMGPVMPCDSMENRMLIDGRFAAGQVVSARAVGDGCVCFQQTYAPLSDSDWSMPRRLCSPCGYNPGARVWICPPNREPTISIRVPSSREAAPAH
jgi:hypothetical protein